MPKAARHKEALVQAAVRLFRRQGYAATGLQQILTLSGAPKGSLYHYFPGGKESIGEAAVAQAGALVAETLRGIAAKHPRPAAFARAYCRQYAEWMDESGFQAGCPIATTLLETAPRSEPIAAAGRAAIQSWIEIIAPVFQRSGISRAEARKRAELLIASLEGALILARVTRSRAPILNVGRMFSRSE